MWRRWIGFNWLWRVSSVSLYVKTVIVLGPHGRIRMVWPAGEMSTEIWSLVKGSLRIVLFPVMVISI